MLGTSLCNTYNKFRYGILISFKLPEFGEKQEYTLTVFMIGALP